jgi:mono/diheme cytochrome c family protein
MKVVMYILGGLVLLVGGVLGALTVKQPATAAPSSVVVEATPERLQRGRYLFEDLADCAGCHSPRDNSKFAWPVVPGQTGAGLEFPAELGLPGKIVAPNLTPDKETGIGTWTDGEKIRAIREGIAKDGKALFTFMPYKHFAKLSDEDVYSVVAYLNSLPPIKNRLPRTELNFPVNLLVKFNPKPVEGKVNAPDRTNKVAYGEYLVNAAGCILCHSKLDKGEPTKGMEYGGGEEFRIGEFIVNSQNISPDEETGIGKWSEDRFVAKFKGYANMTFENAPRATQANFTIMPWPGFSQLPEEDLRAIYAFLRTVKPVRNAVDVHPVPPPPQS